ncbi:MAG TPA: TetR/AcrR family transcriptional regulator [Mycobacteriales bacterium]|jgi:AcrR family transcriptional regulator|nr:TetR/AcrR family transcriptional regulator [Mycobacteriales bacterium]
MPEETVEPVDGRLARSHRTRRGIVDALRSLHAEGDLRPTAPRVAERAGVSLRTVWQHFDDLEELFVEAGRVDVEIASSYITPVDGGLPLAQRVDAVVEQRVRMFEAMAPTWRAARLQEPFSPQIQSNRDRLMELGRAHVASVFRDELAGAPAALLDAVHAATSWALWESLRNDLGLDVAASRRAVDRIVRGLLAAGDEEER